MPNPEQKILPLRRFYCDFGILHDLHETCGCRNRYGVSPWDFKATLQNTFGTPGRYVYASDVTEKMRNTVLAALKWRETMEARNLA